MSQAFSLTDEQLLALDMAKKGACFKIVAYAGAGKTSTLKFISEHLKGRGLYLAFNKAIATEAAQKFAPNVRCQTFHSLAYRHVSRAVTAKLSYPKVTGARLADELGLSAISVRTSSGKSSVLGKARLGMIIADSLSHFCKTHAKAPAPRHIILPDWMDANQAKALQEQLFSALQTRWVQAIDARHPAGINHDVYLKLWTLSNPVIPADFILFDEAQDADPLMMGALLKQSAQTIYVGDAHQQIYEWRGAVNAMKRLPLQQSLLTQSFRFGKEVADVANVLLRALQETTPLRGHSDKQSHVLHQALAGKKRQCPDVYLCRTNAMAMAKLLQGQRLGHNIALHIDTMRILNFCQGAKSLQQGKGGQATPELSYFSHWSEVQEFAQSQDGSEIKTWVKLVDEYGVDIIATAINKVGKTKNADYTITTAHKSKGLEWDHVELAQDFLYTVNKLSVKIEPEELRLLYVAVTRAKKVLDVHNIADLLHALVHKKVVYA